MATSAEIAAYLRVAAYTVALFDYLQTIPAEFRLYAKQKGLFKLSCAYQLVKLVDETYFLSSTACILFILVRYLGVITLSMGVIGFFYHGFSKESCSHYFWVVPVFKLFLYLASQAILTLRTYAVSRKSPVVLYILAVLFLVCTVVRLLIAGRVCFDILETHSCTSGNLPGVKVASLFYAACLIFDAVTMILSAGYLWKFSNSSRASIGRLTKMMLEDGIVYFIVLTAMNLVNLVFFQSRDTVRQSSAASLGYAVTMVFSSRFILNLSERTRDGLSGDNSRTSRTPMSGGRRGPPHTTGGEDAMVVTVTKNVMTMHDMGPDDVSERQVKGETWGIESA
ncbi:hypothetical protein C8F04DRAFT_1189831 [Mycena alexandri]|uniref:Uncharacterized protein n=1 Tax=Mycena alexandri TaxID=1745969 RepID=A0AAD6SFU0_9AGAR|nr:hypothetical protein C8F04DRAFT_1189831 [Mycena alexandri]